MNEPRPSAPAPARCRPNQRQRRFVAAAVGVAGIGLAYLLFWPTPVDPAAWSPPDAPALTGDYALNQRLGAVERLADGFGLGPESVAIDALGRIYTGYRDGRIVRIVPGNESSPELFVNTGGRPLGMQFDGAGDLIVCDAMRGLLRISPGGEITVLAESHNDTPLNLTDDLDIAKSTGVIYFTDASSKYTVEDYELDFLEFRPQGRLLAYDPATDELRLLLDDLHFANGVAIASDESYILINETAAYRVRRYWLKGTNQGTSDMFIENLPGFPDGVSRSESSDGVYWIALVSPRSALVDWGHERPWFKKLVSRLPRWMRPSAKAHGFVLGVKASGEVIHNLQDPEGDSIATISSVLERDGLLYFGTFDDDAIGRMPAPR